MSDRIRSPEVAAMPESMMQRRYTWKLYPTKDQHEVLRLQARMVAALWNALLERHETIRRRTVQRQSWIDSKGRRHVGESLHSLTYETIRYARGERSVVAPGSNGKPKPWSCYDMQNEVTYLLNVDPEWRALSCWTALRTAQLLDRAFQAFYRRAREGAGAAAGYPRFKRLDRADSIPHRFASGCKLRSDEDRHARAWAVTLKGVPSPVHAHGAIPAHVEKFTDADVMFRDGYWWLSAACEIEQRRQSRRARDIEIRFDLLDGMVRVNGVAQQIEGLPELIMDDRAVDEMRREMDLRWPRNARLDIVEAAARDDALDDIRRLMASIRRRRANALHVWSARIVSEARSIHVVLPRLSEHVESGRGDAREWGANVKTVAHANRGVLANGAAMAAAMLRYKAEEAGVPCIVETEAEPEVAVIRDLKNSGQKVRRAARDTKHEGRKQKRAA